ncbi:hypothetical protein [Paraflavitalea speifideaquila]|uniref:hypothetical protein n=1 Tax=Paraflavitalea speifideaquila TaxID=3076558 RepID=UPI0028EE2D80|nr:hypothetical protein [Paraflavitalea speifideiaquila]
MYAGVISEGQTDQTTKSQTATQPISILCYLCKSGKENSTKPIKNLFDFEICANESSNQLTLTSGDKNLDEWYKYLNHAGTSTNIRANKEISELTLRNYTVTGNTILSLKFQLNQLLMLINNPMLFPHQAYVNMFNKNMPVVQ